MTNGYTPRPAFRLSFTPTRPTPCLLLVPLLASVLREPQVDPSSQPFHVRLTPQLHSPKLFLAKNSHLSFVCLGPFELTKLNAQIAVLMERGVGHMNSMDADAGRSPARPGHNNSMGTFGTAKMIMQHRGLMGLYSGFHLHLRELPSPGVWKHYLG